MAEPRIASVQPERTEAFRRAHERDALSTSWGFRVVWHEQRHEFAALEDEGAAEAAGRSEGEDKADGGAEAVVGVLSLRIAASLAHLDSLIVEPTRRRRGVGRALLERAEEVANYYNCHKVVVEIWAEGQAREFFEACGYHVEAILPQHTWKLDVAVMRKFLL